MTDFTIEVKELTMEFGSFKAVDSLSFRVERGSIFGLLGANGAGKSTTIRMLCGLLRSTSGTATVGGYDINTQSEEIKKNIGYMSQKFSLYEDLTVKENIRFFAGIYGLEEGQLEDRLQWPHLAGGIEGWWNHVTGELPAGWKQRLALICAVLHKPGILFLDEPTGGVDPLSRRDFWDIISELSVRGTTVIVTTHYLDEAEYCEKIALMHAGRLIAWGSPKELKAEHMGRPLLELRCERPVAAMNLLRKEPWVLDISLFGTSLHLNVEDERQGRQRISALLQGGGIRLDGIEPIKPSLEDVFIHLIEKQAGDPAVLTAAFRPPSEGPL